jgi:hypothetical protein
MVADGVVLVSFTRIFERSYLEYLVDSKVTQLGLERQE